MAAFRRAKQRKREWEQEVDAKLAALECEMQQERSLSVQP